jgi:uncharacterized OB-fold protein
MSETKTYDKPLPTLDDGNRPFWTAARAGKLTLQHCNACQKPRYPINHICPHCLSDKFEWKAVSGRGTVYSSIVFHQIYNQAFAGDVPYNVALIQLEEGPRMISNVVGIPPSEVKVGDKVQAVFDPVTPEISIPRFKRAA